MSSEVQNIKTRDRIKKLTEALSIALQYVPTSSDNPIEQRDIDKIDRLIKEATN